MRYIHINLHYILIGLLQIDYQHRCMCAFQVVHHVVNGNRDDARLLAAGGPVAWQRVAGARRHWKRKR